MTVTFKSRRKYYIYDSKSGYISELSKLEYEISSYIDIPMAPICPTSLRYELAKFDSDDISNAYSKFLDLYNDGKIFSSVSKNDTELCLTYIDTYGESVAADAISSFFDQASRRVVYELSQDGPRALAEEVAEEKGFKVK